MKKMKLILLLLFGLLLSPIVEAQTNSTDPHIVCFGSTHPYRVDYTENAGAGTTGSTYAWSILTGGFTGSIATNQGPGASSNAISINWGTTPAGNYVLQVIETNGSCPGTPIQLTVQVVPLPTIDAGTNIAICEGSPTTLTASGGATYAWSPSTGLSATTGSSVVATPALTQIYTVTGTDANGCTNTDNVTVTVNPVPTISVTTAAACAPDLLSYSVSVTVSAGTVTSTAGTVLNTSGNIWSISNIPTGTNITATVTSNSCPNAVSITSPSCPCPTVNPPVFVANAAYCLGSPIPSISVTVPVGVAVDWYDAASAGNLLVGASNSYTPTGPGTFYAEARNIVNGCLSITRTAVTVTENPLPTISITSGPTCAVNLLTYSVEVTVSAGTVTSTSGTVVNTSGNIWTISGVATGTNITLTVTSSVPCSNTLAVASPNCSCATIAAPVFVANAAYCIGNPIPTISVTVPAGIAVDWYDAAALGTLLASNSTTYTPTGSGIFYAIAREISTGCLSSTRTAVTVTQNPLPTINAGLDQIICVGNSVVLTVTGGSTYSWSPTTGLSSSTGSPVTANPATTQTYIVTGTDSNGCINTDSVLVTVTPLPTTSPIFHD
jgi:hypothetical protein